MLDRAEQAANNIRASLGLVGPVSAFEVARRLKMPATLERFLPRRGLTLPGPRIYVRDGDRGTRQELACAHEIGHQHIWDVNAAPDLVERACSRFAAALLLPAAEFRESVSTTGIDPPQLAKLWRFSSLEVIGRRIAEVVKGASAAAWLELEPKWREGAGPRCRWELEAVSEAYCRARGAVAVEGRAGVLRVWRTGTGPRSAVSVLQAA